MRSQRPAYLSINCGIGDLEAIAYGNQVCNAYGMDTISAGVTIAWAMECFERGLIGLEDTGGLDESSSQVVKFVDQVLITAYRNSASDIHIEPSPQTKSTNIRFRMDGVCQDYIKVPNSLARGIISRIKIMSNLDIAERRLPRMTAARRGPGNTMKLRAS